MSTQMMNGILPKMLLSLSVFVSTALAQSIPMVENVAPGSHPAIPSRRGAPKLSLDCFASSHSIRDGHSPTCPVIKWRGYTYWAYTYVWDNPAAMAIVAYDSAGTAVQLWKKFGARYLYKITVDTTAKKVTFWGQGNRSITMTWDQLLPRQAPTVKRVAQGSHPRIPRRRGDGPRGLDTFSRTPTCPVIKWRGYTYWAYSYHDGRAAMRIVAYDSAGKAVQQWNKSGARYLYKITVDKAAKKVTFWGQGNQSITMTWDQLLPSGRAQARRRAPTIKRVASGSHPAIPSRRGAPKLSAVCWKGPNSPEASPTCPVIKWSGYTYWAYTYHDGRVATAIVAYDSAGKAVQQWSKSGARYVHKITVDKAAKKVTFWGQGNQTIVMGWNQLRSSGN